MTQHHDISSEFIENRTFDEIAVGDSATLVRTCATKTSRCTRSCRAT